MRFRIILILTACYLQTCAQSEKKLNSSTTIKPPVFITDANGKTVIDGWEKLESEQGNLYAPKGLKNATTPGFFQMITPNNNYNAERFFKFLASNTALKNISLKEVVMNSHYLIEGKMLVACFGQGQVEGKKVYFFMDLNGPDLDNKIIGNLVYATPEVFNAWNGVLFPLVLNGYVKDPSTFEDKSVFKVVDFASAATFYGAMVDAKLYSELSVMSTLSNEANKAMQNASTISNCILSDNCDITYDAEGKAQPNYKN